jgi:hypothetical protein
MVNILVAVVFRNGSGMATEVKLPMSSLRYLASARPGDGYDLGQKHHSPPPLANFPSIRGRPPSPLNCFQKQDHFCA